MTTKSKHTDSLTKLLGASGRPIYAIDGRRQIVYCNAALASWLGLKAGQIVGRAVEYHSEPDEESSSAPGEAGPLAALCPPPRAMLGEPCGGTVACVARDGRLVHRQAEFIPLSDAGGGVLVILAGTDMSPQELTAELGSESTEDELHRQIRQFRRRLATHYSLPSLLGESRAMEKVRCQVAAAASSGANVLISGPRGSGRSHVARVIHYQAAAGTNVKLVPVDCDTVSDDLLRRALDALRDPLDARGRPTLLLENLEQLNGPHQSYLLTALHQREIAARLIATLRPALLAGATVAEGDRVPPERRTGLMETLSIITIRMPRLAERPEDLPLLAQYFLEACNQGRGKQIGTIRPEALDLLALYGWPGELDELRTVITAAHRAATTHEITPRDLPAIIHHAASAASMRRRSVETIELDQLLAAIEKAAIERALAQAGGNKTVAASLLGLSRPRFYRRLVQLGLAAAVGEETEADGPEFVEQDPAEPET